MNEDKIFFLRGFYNNNNGIIKVWVLNLTDEPKLLLRWTKIGKCIKADSLSKFSVITACLNKLRNESSFQLMDIEMNTINQLKKAFTVARLRTYPDYYSPEPFILTVDFSRLVL